MCCLSFTLCWHLKYILSFKKFLLLLITEPQITEWLVLQGTSRGHPVHLLPPALKQVPLEQVAQDHTQAGFKYLRVLASFAPNSSTSLFPLLSVMPT